MGQVSHRALASQSVPGLEVTGEHEEVRDTLTNALRLCQLTHKGLPSVQAKDICLKGAT